MNRNTLIKPELDERSFGSAFDPVLNGVAEGLARLFPPVRKARRLERQDEGMPPRDTDEDARGEERFR